MLDRKLNIVIVGPAHPLRGGLATYNERLARELMKNHHVTLLTFTLQYPNFLFPGESQFSSDPKPSDLNIDVALNSINPFNWIKTGLKYRKLKPDLIIFRWWMPFFGPAFGTFARLVKGNKHTKIVAITDNIYPHEPKIIDKPFSKYFLPTLDGAVAMSRKVERDLIDYPIARKIKNTAYHAHPLYDNFGDIASKDEACKKLNINPDDNYLLFFGFIRHYKGLDIILEALPRLKPYQNLKLLVAGEFYEDRAPYDKLIADLGISNQVILHTHFIPNDDVRYYFSAADVVVQPYRTATQSGVSQVAYHFNKPMVVTSVGGLGELIPEGKAGLSGEPIPDCMAAQIEKILKPGVLGDMSANMQEIKKQFSWESMAKQLLAVAEL